MLNKHSFVCQEYEAICHQVLHVMGLHAFHQNSIEYTQDDSISMGQGQEEEEDNEKNVFLSSILPQIIIRIAMQIIRIRRISYND